MPFFNQSFSTALASKSSGTGSYLNPSKIPDGGSARFQVLSEEPVTGYELWFTTTEGKQVPRRTPDEPTPSDIAAFEKEVGGTLVIRDGKPAVKAFAAFYVFDVDTSTVKVFSATQTSILQELDRQLSDPDFAVLSDWDIEVGRTGKGMNTEYTVTLKPTRVKGPLATAAKAAYNAVLAAGGTLDALFTGGDPMGSAR